MKYLRPIEIEIDENRGCSFRAPRSRHRNSEFRSAQQAAKTIANFFLLQNWTQPHRLDLNQIRKLHDNLTVIDFYLKKCTVNIASQMHSNASRGPLCCLRAYSVCCEFACIFTRPSKSVLGGMFLYLVDCLLDEIGKCCFGPSCLYFFIVCGNPLGGKCVLHRNALHTVGTAVCGTTTRYTLRANERRFVTVWQCMTVYYGVTQPVHSTCVLSECSSAIKLIVRQLILRASFGVCLIALSQLLV